jgi:hypothetical protein
MDKPEYHTRKGHLTPDAKFDITGFKNVLALRADRRRHPGRARALHRPRLLRAGGPARGALRGRGSSPDIVYCKQQEKNKAGHAAGASDMLLYRS